MNLRNAVASFIFATTLVILFIQAYSDIATSYSLIPGDMQVYNGTNQTVIGHLSSINVLEGLNDLEQGILKLQPPSGSSTDILGGLSSVGIGAVKLVLGLITTPYEFMNVIITFYAGEIPGVIAGIITQLVVIYVGFLLLSLYTRTKV